MSYQKKSAIIYELQQAIKKKTVQKSKAKQNTNKYLQTSIEKRKRQISKKEIKFNTVTKNEDAYSVSKQEKLSQKPMSIFLNQYLTTVDTKQFKVKKYNNRKFDKLISLMHYLISSSEKVLKYISSNNFEAQFAIKLYKSDKDNLANQLKNLTLDDIIDSQRSNEKPVGKTDRNYQQLIQQNSNLKKDIVVLEKQAERFHRSFEKNDKIENVFLQVDSSKQMDKVKQTLRKVIPFEYFKQVIDGIQKQVKYEQMAQKEYENIKKNTEIELVIASLQSQRSNTIQSIKKKMEPRTQRNTAGFTEIQIEKENLQKQLDNLKEKLNSLKQNSNYIKELQQLKTYHAKNQDLKQSLCKILKIDQNVNNTIQIITSELTQRLELSSKLISENNKLKLQLKTVTIQFKNKSSKQQCEFNQMHLQNIKLKDQVQHVLTQKQQIQEKYHQLDSIATENQSQSSTLRLKLNSIEQTIETISLQNQKLIQQLQFRDIQLQRTQNYYKDQIQRYVNKHISIKQQFEKQIHLLSEQLIASQSQQKPSFSQADYKSILNKERQQFRNLQSKLQRSSQLSAQVTAELQTQIHENQDELSKTQDLLDNLIKQQSQRKELMQQLELENSDLKLKIKDIINKSPQKQTNVSVIQEQNQRMLQQTSQLTHQIQLLSEQNKNLKQQIWQKEDHKTQESKSSEKYNFQQQNMFLLAQKQQLQSLHNQTAQKYKKLQLDSQKTASQNITVIQNQNKQIDQKTTELQILQESLTQASTKLQHQSQITHLKNKQYTNLLKLILKGFSFEEQQIFKTDNFQELLEVGSQEVLKMRKRMREEESVKRKVKRQSDYCENSNINDLIGSLDQSCKVQLFSGQEKYPGKAIFTETQKIYELAKNVEEEEKQSKEDMVNNSAISNQQLQRSQLSGNEIDDFNELQSQKMDDSFISQSSIRNQCQKLTYSIKQKPKNQHQQHQQPLQNNLQYFNDLKSQKMNASMMSEDNPINKSTQSKKDIEDFSEVKEQDQMGNSSVFSYRENQEKVNVEDQRLQDFEEVKSDQINDSMVSEKINSSFGKMSFQKSKESQRQGKKSNQEAQLDEFNEYKSQKMNDSILSQQMLKIQPFTDIMQTSNLSDRQLPKSNQLSKKSNQSKQLSKGNFSQFQEYKSQQMNNSALTQKSNPLAQFSEYKDQSMNDSILSQQSQQ